MSDDKMTNTSLNGGAPDTTSTPSTSATGSAQNMTSGIGMAMGRRGPGMRGAPVEKPKDGKNTFKRLLKYFRQELGLVIALAVIVVAGVACSVIAPGLQSNAIDRIVGARFDTLPKLLIIMVIFYVGYGLSTLIQGRLSAALSQRIIKRMRSDLFGKIVRLPVSYIDGHSHGDLMSRMTNDAENVSNVISSSLSSLFSGVLMLIGTASVMLWYNVPLTALSCSTVVLTVLFTRFMSKKMRVFFVKRQQLLGSVNGTVEEMVGASRTVTAYNYQDEAIRQFSETADQLTKTGIKAEIIGNFMGPVMNMFNNISFVIVAVFGAWFALKGYITVGVISAFIVYSKQFSRPINELAQLYGQIQTAIAGAERIFSILDEKEEPSDGKEPAQPVQGVIEFKHVNFSYVPGKPIIRDFNLKVESGKKIALVGTTGSGKTTIINLLMRFYEIDSGEILLDGVNIKDLSIHGLRDAIGIVLQDTILFTDTVRYNLTYADPDVPMEEIRAAAASSNCEKMIAAWPEGYDTMLLASGTGLSQGQRQLLTIGRAFLSYPQILILDEATSSVDTRTEKNIQDAMVELMENRTSLIIAHRISTIRDADQIIVMDQGTIAESGTHEELLALGGVYHELYMTQFAGQQT